MLRQATRLGLDPRFGVCSSSRGLLAPMAKLQSPFQYRGLPRAPFFRPSDICLQLPLRLTPACRSMPPNRRPPMPKLEARSRSAWETLKTYGSLGVGIYLVISVSTFAMLTVVFHATGIASHPSIMGFFSKILPSSASVPSQQTGFMLSVFVAGACNKVLTVVQIPLAMAIVRWLVRSTAGRRILTALGMANRYPAPKQPD